MKILVTGAAGFVGHHLLKELAEHGHKVVAFDLAYSSPPANAAEVHTGDLRDASVVERHVAAAKADACIHLGAITFVPSGRSNPDTMLSVNILGTVNVMEAFRRYQPAAKILFISTSHVYGPTPENVSVKEDFPLAPVTMYAISKAAADSATLAYAKHHHMRTIVARPSNHTGPGQSPQFVVPSLARQIKAIAAGGDSSLKVGNVDSKRDFTDVRDVVRAYRLLLEKGRDGEAYNISSQNILRIGTVLDKLASIAGVKPRIVVDPEKFRPYDSSPLLDVSKLQEDTGWKPGISLETTLTDLLAES